MKFSHTKGGKAQKRRKHQCQFSHVKFFPCFHCHHRKSHFIARWTIAPLNCCRWKERWIWTWRVREMKMWWWRENVCEWGCCTCKLAYPFWSRDVMTLTTFFTTHTQRGKVREEHYLYIFCNARIILTEWKIWHWKTPLNMKCDIFWKAYSMAQKKSQKDCNDSFHGEQKTSAM
jgi:hypothetical protein